MEKQPAIHIIPPTLDTVEVLVNVGIELCAAYRCQSNDEALQLAVSALGLTDTIDTHGLIALALREMEAR